MSRGLFISIEGVDGSGKTTQGYLLKDSLSSQGYEVVLLDDEYTTRIGRAVRVIRSEARPGETTSEADLLLVFAERVQLADEVIHPAMAGGKIVIVEGFTDGTLCYNGFGCGADIPCINSIDKASTGGMRPNLTIILDLPAEVALRRVVESGMTRRIGDRDVAFYERVRDGFLSIAKKEAHRVKVVDAARDIDDVFFTICRIVYDEMNPT
ncbi:MAG: dTMP kinase [Chloroflexota bacterium]